MIERSANTPYAEVVSGLRRIGYLGPLLEEGYKFSDWFTPQLDQREAAVATFGQTPVSYESACIGVAIANGLNSQALVDGYRALGAPIILEIDNSEIREWAVSRTANKHGLVERYPINRITEMFASRAADWKPEPLLRAKNIGSFRWSEQLGLFTGLLPELEEHIQKKLDPLLRDVLLRTSTAYMEGTRRKPDPAKLFKLVFWILTAKVFHDRRVNGFASLDSDADELLNAVAEQYKVDTPALLTREARQAAADRIWSRVDFRNLSVEVLAQICSATLVDDETRKRLGIHRTSRTIVRYIVERIPFEQAGDEKKIILEPCSGSAVFLIGAMNELRKNLFLMSPAERHKYFTQHLAAIEKDPFAVEISRLALTLADFPNPDGWDVTQKDLFEPNALMGYLQRTAIVLCNPPFGDFDSAERQQYQPSSTKKPVELLQRVLHDLHPRGVLGFVLPRNFVDGKGYAGVRKQLAERFATLDVTILPDRAFDSDSEVALLIATDPIPHAACRIFNRKVNDDAESWLRFEIEHSVSTENSVEFGIEEAGEGIAVPELPEVWEFLSNFPTLGEFADLHRGIEWNKPLTMAGAETGHRSTLVRDSAADGFRLGVAPQTKFTVLERPAMSNLSMRPADQRGNAWQNDWDQPKAILNKAARSRGPWKIAAFPDSEGLVFYQTYIGVWPKSDRYDEWLLSAVLNSPVANAFVATREGKTDITMETLSRIPMPHFTESQRQRLRSLIRQYQQITRPLLAMNMAEQNASRLLKEIDALVLDGYRMPPRVERRLLDYFRGQTGRPTWHDFGDYIPADCDVYFSLSEFLSPDFGAATSGEFLKRMAVK